MVSLKGYSMLIAAAFLMLVAVASTIVVYTATINSVEHEYNANKLCKAKVDAAMVRPGYAVLYMRSINCNVTVDRVYIQDEKGNTIGYIPVVPPATLQPGRVVAVPAPLLLAETSVNQTGPIRLAPASTYGVVVSAATGGEENSLAGGEAVKPSTVVGLVAVRGPGCSTGDLRVRIRRIHWIYIDILTGEYRIHYVSGRTEREASGKAVVLYNGSLDLSSMTWEQRYRLGPVVVMINPTRATQPYRVTVKPIYNAVHRFTLNPLVDDPNKVVYDAVLFWEDLWWPGTSARLDNYVDHVIRVTLFTNGTTRLEVLRASGCYLHMFMYSPSGLPDFDTVPSIVREYAKNRYRLPESSSVVYVKTHGAWIPPLDRNDVWDPVHGKWVTKWPPVFRLNTS